VHRYAVLYDRDCGFCRWSLGLLLRWDRRSILRPIALQDLEADRLLAGVPEEDRMTSWHLVAPGGQMRSAGAAAGPLFRLLPGGRPLAALFERFPRATNRGYRWVAEHRNLFGKLVRERSTGRADALIVERAEP
jgi:predicted DCC family thiol-disulfide oxidoreductase YuxK